MKSWIKIFIYWFFSLYIDNTFNILSSDRSQNIRKPFISHQVNMTCILYTSYMLYIIKSTNGGGRGICVDSRSVLPLYQPDDDITRWVQMRDVIHIPAYYFTFCGACLLHSRWTITQWILYCLSLAIYFVFQMCIIQLNFGLCI